MSCGCYFSFAKFYMCVHVGITVHYLRLGGESCGVKRARGAGTGTHVQIHVLFLENSGLLPQ